MRTHIGPGDTGQSNTSPVSPAVRPSVDYVLPPLPAGLPPLIGRDADLAKLLALIESRSARLITMTGAGGVGKSRLALEAGVAFEQVNPHSAAFIPLAHLQDAALIGPAIATLLRIPRTNAGSLLDHVASYVTRPMLLIFDNFEQIVDAASFVVELLAASPALTVLITSRTRLNVRGEREFRVHPLSAVSPSSAGTDDRLSPAVELFIARVTETNPRFRGTPDRIPLIAEICSKLDGLPLAIELAAARSRVLPLEAMLPLLDRQLSILTGGPRDAPKRQQTLRDTIKWTYDLLPDHARTLLRRLSVFPSGFTLDAATMVANDVALISTTDDPAMATLTLIESLADNSLLLSSGESTGDGAPRFSFYETIRAFGIEQLDATGETEDAFASLIRWCISLKSHVLPSTHGEGYSHFYSLEQEYPNVRAAFVWLRDHGDAKRGLQILEPLTWFMTQRYLLDEAIGWADTFLAMPDLQDDPVSYATGLGSAAQVRHWYSDYARAIDYNKRSIEIWQSLNDSTRVAQALIQQANCMFDAGEPELADDLLDQSLAIYGTGAPIVGRANARLLKGRIALDRMKLEESRRHYGTALAEFEAMKQLTWIALSYESLGLLSLVANDIALATRHYYRAMAMAIDLDDFWRATACITGIAEIARREGSLVRSAQLYAAAESGRAALGLLLRPSTKRVFDPWIEALQAEMGPSAFAEAWTLGVALSRDEAADLAISGGEARESRIPVSVELPPAAVVTTQPLAKFGLTPREVEILILLSQGLGNRDIADQLHISHRTVMQHIANIFPKIDVNTRTAAAAWAHKHRIV